MRRSVGILSTALAGVFAAAMAIAAEPSPHGEQTGASTGKGYVGEHEMTGTVTDVDKDEGRVSIDSEGHKLDLHFPPSALQSLQKGDRVSIRLAIREAGIGSGTSMPGHGTSMREAVPAGKPGASDSGASRPR
jgi:hypothetical protein